jgi:hypothetical protein
MTFRLGITRDFLKPDGSLGFGDIGLGLLSEQPALEWEFLPEQHSELPRGVADQYDARWLPAALARGPVRRGLRQRRCAGLHGQ